MCQQSIISQLAAADVVKYVSEFALKEPRNKTVEIAGPDRDLMTRFVQKYLDYKRDSKVVIGNNQNRYMHLDIPKDLLVPLGDCHKGNITFEEWLKVH